MFEFLTLEIFEFVGKESTFLQNDLWRERKYEKPRLEEEFVVLRDIGMELQRLLDCRLEGISLLSSFTLCLFF
jgi:hypothetical protein